MSATSASKSLLEHTSGDCIYMCCDESNISNPRSVRLCETYTRPVVLGLDLALVQCKKLWRFSTLFPRRRKLRTCMQLRRLDDATMQIRFLSNHETDVETPDDVSYISKNADFFCGQELESQSFQQCFATRPRIDRRQSRK